MYNVPLRGTSRPYKRSGAGTGELLTTDTERQRLRLAARATPANGRRLRRVGYAVALFLSSAGGLVLEIVAGRMIAPYVGMSLYTWTAVIAVVLAGLSIGHWVGGQMAEADRRPNYWRAACSLVAAATMTAASLPLIRLVAPVVLGAGWHPVGAITVLTSALFLLPSLFIGTLSPILTRLAIEELPEAPGKAIGQMFAVGALGSIAGTLAAGYLFISWIGSIGTVLSVAGLYLLLGVAFVAAARPSPRQSFLGLCGLTLPALFVGSIGARVQAFTTPCFAESDYYCIRVIDLTAEIGRTTAAMVIDHLGHGINDRDDPTRLHSSYLELTDRLLRLRLGEPDRFAGFFIGGGANTLPRAWGVRYPEARLHIAEIDPAVTDVARAALWFVPSRNTILDHRDARFALASLPQDTRFDVIVGDAFHDISVPQHLATAEFALLVHARLTPDGFYSLNVIDSGRHPLLLYSMVRTLARTFASVEVWVDVDQLRGGGRATYLVVSGDQPTPVDRLVADRAGGPRWMRWPADDLAARIAEAGVPLLTDDFSPVDRLMLPVLGEDP